MRKLVLPLLVALFLIALPHAAQAAQSGFFGPIISDECTCPGLAPGWGCVLEAIRVLMNFGVSIACAVMALVLAYGGFLFVMSPSNPENRATGRNVLINAFIGLFIVLSAWLIVDFIMTRLYNPSAFGPWNSILTGVSGDKCVQAQTNSPLFSGSGVTAIPQTNGNSGAQPGTLGNSHLNVSAAVAVLDSNAGSSDNSRCLHYVRQALSAGGISLSCPNNGNQLQQYAGQCNGPLAALGFHSLGSSDGGPQAGDIIVVSPVGQHTIGHIAMYDGHHWVSDFVQSDSERPPGCPYDGTTGCPQVQYWRP